MVKRAGCVKETAPDRTTMMSPGGKMSPWVRLTSPGLVLNRPLGPCIPPPVKCRAVVIYGGTSNNLRFADRAASTTATRLHFVGAVDLPSKDTRCVGCTWLLVKAILLSSRDWWNLVRKSVRGWLSTPLERRRRPG